jgi:hypothetical protein
VVELTSADTVMVAVVDAHSTPHEAGTMTTEPKTEVAAVEGTPTSVGEGPTPSRIRVRWGWFFGCIVLGLAAIIVGLFLVSPAGRLGYVGGVLANIGTTLLLVGIVLLLERRIIDTAVRVVQDATKQARLKTKEEVRALIRDYENKVAELWKSATPDRANDETRRLTAELTKRVTEMYAGGDDMTDSRKPGRSSSRFGSPGR